MSVASGDFSVALLRNPGSFQYMGAFSSLLEGLRRNTNFRVNVDPTRISSFKDPRLLRCPILYMLFNDHAGMKFSSEEIKALRDFLDRGGFLYIDGGISPGFLKNQGGFLANHNFPEWKVARPLERFFKKVYPDKIFVPLTRSHPLFSILKRGVPEAPGVPESVYNFNNTIKWKNGAVAMLGLEINGKIGVLTTGVMAMGWRKNHDTNQWINNLRIRVREGNDALADSLRIAAHAGTPFKLVDETGRQETVYTQPINRPAWVNQSNGKWRVFRYYGSPQISAFASEFMTQVGGNILIYVLTH